MSPSLKLPLFFVLLSCVFLGACSTPPPARPTQHVYPQPYPQPQVYQPRSTPPAIHAGKYILLDAGTGRTLAERNADQRCGVASTQKLVTALVVTRTANIDRAVVVQPSDVRVEPTKLGLVPGERISRRSLTNAMLVKSGNDGANALARDNAGSIPAFTSRMNMLARHYGATNSNFMNPHGLSAPGQYSTARDMSRIAMVAYRDPFIRGIVGQPYTTFRGRSLKNTNKLLGNMPECDGMKTGYTRATGKCLISSASSGGRSVILVQLNSSIKYIWNDAETMMRWGLANL